MPTNASTTSRGYGTSHQRERARWRPIVEAGQADCAEIVCINPSGRPIAPTARWDLAHDRVNGGYLGPAHRACNRSEGARYGNHQRSPNGTPSNAW